MTLISLVWWQLYRIERFDFKLGHLTVRPVNNEIVSTMTMQVSTRIAVLFWTIVSTADLLCGLVLESEKWWSWRHFCDGFLPPHFSLINWIHKQNMLTTGNGIVEHITAPRMPYIGLFQARWWLFNGIEAFLGDHRSWKQGCHQIIRQDTSRAF